MFGPKDQIPHLPLDYSLGTAIIVPRAQLALPAYLMLTLHCIACAWACNSVVKLKLSACKYVIECVAGGVRKDTYLKPWEPLTTEMGS